MVFYIVVVAQVVPLAVAHAVALVFAVVYLQDGANFLHIVLLQEVFERVARGVCWVVVG